MGVRTGKKLLESLRDDRQLFIDGQRVRDVTADPRFAEAARSLAALYDMQHDAALNEQMTFRSPTSGERVGLSFIEPRSVDDLIRRRDMVKIWMDASCGMFGRSPDFMNIFVTAFASAADEFGHKDKRFAENLRVYHAYIRENDILIPLRGVAVDTAQQKVLPTPMKMRVGRQALCLNVLHRQLRGDSAFAIRAERADPRCKFSERIAIVAVVGGLRAAASMRRTLG